jgi:hypothetical protein
MPSPLLIESSFGCDSSRSARHELLNSVRVESSLLIVELLMP